MIVSLAVAVVVLATTTGLLTAALLRFEAERLVYISAILAERKYPGAAQTVLAPQAHVEEPREFIVPEGL